MCFVVVFFLPFNLSPVWIVQETTHGCGPKMRMSVWLKQTSKFWVKRKRKKKWFSRWVQIQSAVNICCRLWDPDCMNEVSVSCLSFCPSSHLEKSLQMLMDRVDDMCQDISKYNNYSRNLSKQQQQKHQVAHPYASQSFSRTWRSPSLDTITNV